MKYTKKYIIVIVIPNNGKTSRKFRRFGRKGRFCVWGKDTALPSAGMPLYSVAAGGKIAAEASAKKLEFTRSMITPPL